MGNPILGSLTDAFTTSTLNSALWNKLPTGWALDTVHQYVTVPVPTAVGVNAFGTNNLFDATGQAISARVGVAQTGAGHVGTRMRIRLDANNAVTMRYESVSFQLNVVTGGTTVTTTLPAYDPTQHAWWRLRESGGSFYADVSADGALWTNLASMAYTWSPTAVTFQFEAVALATESAGNLAWFASVSTLDGGGSTLMPSWPKIRFQVAFNTGGQMTTQPAYVDLSTRLRGSWSADLAGRQYELDQVQSGQAGVTLWNLDGALDPTNVSSPYYPNVIPMRAARLQAVWPPTRNLLPQNISNGTAPSNAWRPYVGTVAPVSGLSAAPTGHTTATAWTFPITASSANGYPMLTGTTLGSADASAFPVVGGLPYVLTSWLSRSAGGDATLGVIAEVIFYDQTGAQVSAPTGTVSAVPVQGSWAQLTVSGTAPSTAVCARLAFFLTNSSTTAVNTIYVTALQLEQSSTATPWTAGGVVYGLWAGFVERWPQQWNYSGTYGLVDLTCIDLLAGLAQFTLSPSFSASLLALNPQFVYPLNEASGATQFHDLTGQSPARLVYSPPRLGAGGGTITAGNSVQGSGSVGSAGPVVTLTNPNWGLNGVTKAGVLLAAFVGKNLPPTSGGLTRIICYRTTNVPTSGNAMCLWAATGPGVNGSGGSKAWLGIYLDPNQHLYGVVQDVTGAYGATVTVPDVAACDGNWHIAVVQISADLKTFTVANDSFGYAVGTAGTYTLTGINADTIGAQANPTSNTWQQYFQGDLAYASQFSSPIGNSAAFDLGSGFSTGWAGETSAARAQRILTMTGYGGTISTQGATIAMGGANLAGTDPVSALTLVGDTEAGQVYVDGSGVPWLTGRLWRYLQASPTVVFGENQASGEVPYLGDVALDFDTTHIYNAAQVTQVVAPGSSQPPVQPVTNSASQQAYLPRTIQRSINTQDQTLALAAGQYLVSQYGQPLPRLAALNVDLASNPALLSTVLGLGFGTRAQVNRRPPSGPGAAAISVQQFVEHLSWVGDDQGNLKLALQLTPAGPYLNWWVVASLHTIVATASTAGTATVTLGPLTGSANNPAAAVLAPGTQLTLSYGTSNAETMTVKSVAATSPGYTSVAVTFTANTAHNHAINDTVCQPLPGGYQLPAAVSAAYPASLDAGATLSATGPRVAY